MLTAKAIGSKMFLYDEDSSAETTPRQEFQEETELNVCIFFLTLCLLNTAGDRCLFVKNKIK